MTARVFFYFLVIPKSDEVFSSRDKVFLIYRTLLKESWFWKGSSILPIWLLCRSSKDQFGLFLVTEEDTHSYLGLGSLFLRLPY